MTDQQSDSGDSVMLYDGRTFVELVRPEHYA